MGTTTHDIFGDAAAARPAEPDSYGEAPRGFRLPAATRLGRVRLQVSDLARALAFYEDVLGFRAVEREASRAVLAAHDDDTPLVELREHAGARRITPRARLGLFHFAILLPDRPALGRFLAHLGALGIPAGMSDHLVSEAIYLSDPDGLG
ncbi:MAG TPA: VOC family protein, partial [Gemmatimonadaceae bacterium]|nr:VOC family protein [Gemmatimonadaceae bacterium]